MTTTEQSTADIVSAFLSAAGLAEWTPIRIFVIDSARVVTSPLCRPWIDFEIDEQIKGRWFRVTYSLLRSREGDESWDADALQLICVSPSGIPHHEGMTLGDAALNPQNRCNGYDLAFHAWFIRHGWQIHRSPSGIDVWTNDDEKCPFKVTQGMIDRLEWNGLIERIFPPGSATLDYVYQTKAN